MELFGVGIGEAGLVLLIALLVVGPERFPRVARDAGRWYNMARRFAADVTADLQGALKELENEVNEQTGDLKTVREIGEEVRAGVRESSTDVRAIGAGVGAAAAASGAEYTSNGAAAPPGAPGAPVEATTSLESDATPAPTETGNADPFELVRRSYASYHTPPPPPAPTIDPDEMSRHAMEAFEGYRGPDIETHVAAEPEPAVLPVATPANSGVSPSLLTAVNPFSSAPPAAQVMQSEEPPPEGESLATTASAPTDPSKAAPAPKPPTPPTDA